MFRKLSLAIVLSLSMVTFGQINTKSKPLIQEESQKITLAQSTLISIDTINSKSLKRQIRKGRKSKSKGTSLIALVEIQNDASNFEGKTSYNEKQSLRKKQSSIRPAFRPISIEQIAELKAEQKQISNTQSDRRIVNMLNYKAKKTYSNKQRVFWAVEEIINGSCSNRSMKFVDLKTARKMIVKNKIELKTKLGRNNNLTIWEVYNTKVFMKLIGENPEYANLDKAECFNVESFYESKVAY